MFGRMNESYLRTALHRQLAADFVDIADQVRIRPNLANNRPANFYFIADHLALNPQTSALVAVEGKLSPSATLTANQTAGYPLLRQNGGTVVSRNMTLYPYGTSLPRTPAFRAEPTINLRTDPRPHGQDVSFRMVTLE